MKDVIATMTAHATEAKKRLSAAGAVAVSNQITGTEALFDENAATPLLSLYGHNLHSLDLLSVNLHVLEAELKSKIGYIVAADAKAEKAIVDRYEGIKFRERVASVLPMLSYASVGCVAAVYIISYFVAPRR